jgi:hypothetical protein
MESYRLAYARTQGVLRRRTDMPWIGLPLQKLEVTTILQLKDNITRYTRLN